MNENRIINYIFYHFHIQQSSNSFKYKLTTDLGIFGSGLMHGFTIGITYIGCKVTFGIGDSFGALIFFFLCFFFIMIGS